MTISEDCGDGIVAVGEYIGLDPDQVANRALGCESARIHLGRNGFDHYSFASVFHV